MADETIHQEQNTILVNMAKSVGEISGSLVSVKEDLKDIKKDIESINISLAHFEKRIGNLEAYNTSQEAIAKKFVEAEEVTRNKELEKVEKQKLKISIITAIVSVVTSISASIAVIYYLHMVGI